MTKCTGRNTPMDPGLKLTKTDDPIIDVKKYQKIIGSLMYLMLGTRPDIAFAVNQLAQFSSCPQKQHWTALKQILQYLKRSKHHGLIYRKNTTPEPTKIIGYSQRHRDVTISGFSDADFANAADRKSITGNIFMHRGNIISWQSKKQSLIAGSTMEAEYIAASLSARQGIWLRQMLWELQGKPHHKEVILLYTDSQPAYKVAYNPADHARTKHIDLHYHFLRQRILLQHVTLQLCSTKQMTADFLTKALPPKSFHRFKRSIRCTNAKSDITEWDRQIREEDEEMLDV